MPINNATSGFSFGRSSRRRGDRINVGTQPSISGTQTVGQVLTASPGTGWYPAGATIEYQWFRGRTAIVGENSSTYTLATGDDSVLVQCVIAAVAAQVGVVTKVVAVTGAITPGGGGWTSNWVNVNWVDVGWVD